MTEKEKLIEKEFEDIYQALKRAAQTAKKRAEQNGVPYVVREDSCRKDCSKGYFPQRIICK